MKKYIFVSAVVLMLFVSPAVSLASLDNNLYYGLKNNPDVIQLQKYLSDKGFYSGRVTGNFGSLTLAAVKKYQKSIGLNGTGLVGTLTRTDINKKLAEISLPPPQNINQQVNPIVPPVTPPAVNPPIVESPVTNPTIIKVSLDPTSPKGILFPSLSELVAIFDISNNGAADITFGHPSSGTNQFVVQISRSLSSSDGIPGNWVLKDESGTTLSTVSVGDSDTSVSFPFETNSLSVVSGQPKKLFVYADTHEYVSSNPSDAIQAWLSDASDSNFIFSIDSGTPISMGKSIFRGGIYGNSLIK